MGWRRLQLEGRTLILSLWPWTRTGVAFPRSRNSFSEFPRTFAREEGCLICSGNRPSLRIYFFSKSEAGLWPAESSDVESSCAPPHPAANRGCHVRAPLMRRERVSCQGYPQWEQRSLLLDFSRFIILEVFIAASMCFFFCLFFLGQHLPKHLVARLRHRAKYSRLLQLISSRERHSCFKLRLGFATSSWGAWMEINPPPGLGACVVLILPQLWFVKSWC